MKYTLKPRTVDAIIYDGKNIEQIKQFLGKYYKYGRIMEDGHLFCMLNDNNACCAANIGDYIVIDAAHAYPMNKKSFEEIYIPQP